MFSPRLVPGAEYPPFRCVLSGLVDGPFVDCGVQIDPLPSQSPRAYLHETVAFQLGQTVGMVSGDEHEKTVEALARAREELEEAQRELSESEQALEAVDGLVKRGMVVRKQPGRKPKKEVAA